MSSAPAVPANIDAERSLLSCALVDPDAIPIIESLTPTDFYDHQNRAIFEAVIAAHQQHGYVDFIVVSEIINNRKMGDLSSYLVRLMGAAPSLAYAERYAGIVRDMSYRRRLLAGLTPLVRSINDTEVGMEAVVDQGMALLHDVTPTGNDGTDASSGVAAVLAKTGFYHQNPIGVYETRGIDTGYPQMNAALDGWKPGNAYYLLGTAHSGKTTLALNMAANIARWGGRVLYFSLEQSTTASEDPARASLWDRLVLLEARVETRNWLRGDFGDRDYTNLLDCADIVSGWDITMFDNINTIPMMDAAIRAANRESRADLVVIDYLGLIKQPEIHYESRNLEIGGLTSRLKELARRTVVPILIPHQVSRRMLERRGDKRINMSDAYESSHLEQDADVVLGANLKSFVDQDFSENDNMLEIEVLKDRLAGGTGGWFDLYANWNTGRISSVALQSVPV